MRVPQTNLFLLELNFAGINSRNFGQIRENSRNLNPAKYTKSSFFQREFLKIVIFEKALVYGIVPISRSDEN